MISPEITTTQLYIPRNCKIEKRSQNCLSFFKKEILNNKRAWTNLHLLIIFQGQDPEYRKLLSRAEATDIIDIKNHGDYFEIKASSELSFLTKALAKTFNTGVYSITENYLDSSVTLSFYNMLTYRHTEKGPGVLLGRIMTISLSEYLAFTDYPTYHAMVSSKELLPLRKEVLSDFPKCKDGDLIAFNGAFYRRGYNNDKRRSINNFLGQAKFYNPESNRVYFFYENVITTCGEKSKVTKTLTRPRIGTDIFQEKPIEETKKTYSSDDLPF